MLLLIASTASAQEKDSRSRLDELERKLEDQRVEIERLKTERMQSELRRAPDAPPHVERLPDGSVAASGGSSSLELGYDDGFLLKGTLNGARYVLRPRAFIHAPAASS
ncbi:MAG: hypothetical protein ACAI25_13930 [Planctomycetota bacterium]